MGSAARKNFNDSFPLQNADSVSDRTTTHLKAVRNILLDYPLAWFVNTCEHITTDPLRDLLSRRKGAVRNDKAPVFFG
jgi:hypothetical protein